VTACNNIQCPVSICKCKILFIT